MVPPTVVPSGRATARDGLPAIDDRQPGTVENRRRLTGSRMTRGPCERRRRSSVDALEAHDVFVSDAHEHIVAIPEDRPAILLFDVGGLDLAFVLELVAADVDAVRVQLEPLLICTEWLVWLAHGTG